MRRRRYLVESTAVNLSPEWTAGGIVEPRGGRSRYLQGIARTESYYQDYAILGHGGATLGFTARMYSLEDTHVVVVLLANVGQMHSGLQMSPVSTFFRHVWLPAVMRYLGREPATSLRPSGIP